MAAGLYARRVNKGDEFSRSTPGTPEYDAARKEWEDARLGVLLAAPLGAVFLATGEALSLHATSPCALVGLDRRRGRGRATDLGYCGDGFGRSMRPGPDRHRGVRVRPRVDRPRGAVTECRGTVAFLPVWAVTQRSKIEIQAAGAGFLVRGEF